MTQQELMDSQELEEYSLFYGWELCYNRFIEAVVFSRDGEDYKLKDSAKPSEVLAAIREIPQGDPLLDFLERVEYPEDEVL